MRFSSLSLISIRLMFVPIAAESCTTSYANHYATIKKWLDEDSKGRSAKNYTYDDNEGECL